jgi:hypothetical protein
MGTLINQGNFITNASTACISLSAIYSYCYLKVPKDYLAVYHMSLSADATCGSPTIIGGGECTSAGSWDSYEVIYSAWQIVLWCLNLVAVEKGSS